MKHNRTDSVRGIHKVLDSTPGYRKLMEGRATEIVKLGGKIPESSVVLELIENFPEHDEMTPDVAMVSESILMNLYWLAQLAFAHEEM